MAKRPKGLTIDITCPVCKGQHTLPLDASGHYAGPAPCDHSKRLRLQVDPSEWREMVEAEAAKRTH